MQYCLKPFRARAVVDIKKGMMRITLRNHNWLNVHAQILQMLLSLDYDKEVRCKYLLAVPSGVLNLPLFNFKTKLYESYSEARMRKWKCEKCSNTLHSYKKLFIHKTDVHS